MVFFRLRQKKFKNIAYTSATAETKDSHHVHLETHDEDEDKLRKLEQAFGLVTDLVQGANGEVLQKMDLDSLLALIDHATKVKNAGSGAEVKRLPLAAKMSENNYREGYEDILKDIDTLLGSKGLGGLPMTDLNTEREQRQRYKEHMDAIMQNKAKTLSSEYNVEKEKYDLKMKIEQARQQQSLQRKLLERRQSNASRPLAPTGGAGYSSVAAGNLLAGMMSHADKSKIGASPAKPFIPDFIAASKSRGLSTNNLYHK